MSEQSSGRRCRSCVAPLRRTFVDLGEMPLANSYLTAADLERPEPRYPLHARVCDRCLLVQVDDVTDPAAIFDDYAYFSSYSDAWVEHARQFAEMAQRRFELNAQSQVIELASNDGYLLRHFAAAEIPVLGIEPARNVARVAEAAGVPTLVRFFGQEVANELRDKGTQADLLVGNNVLGHVPQLNDFVGGMATLLAPEAVVSLEFPHLLRLMERIEFDTIYHEHFSYFSFASTEWVLRAHGLRVFDVEEFETHGGSLRILACRAESSRVEEAAVAHLRAKEASAALDRVATYDAFRVSVERVREALLKFIAKHRGRGHTIAAYGAAAKGNTLLNYCGIGTDEVAFVVDRSPHKQGRYMPGSHLPIYGPDRVREARPDVLLVLAWNHLEEVMEQMRYVEEWGCRFAVPVPTPSLVS